jgi:hypothetical protein
MHAMMSDYAPAKSQVRFASAPLMPITRCPIIVLHTLGHVHFFEDQYRAIVLGQLSAKLPSHLPPNKDIAYQVVTMSAADAGHGSLSTCG